MHDYQGPGRSVAFARQAMCCTSHPFAAKTALDVLGRGGNAVDAAIAGAVVLGFCEPMMTGLGGDVFAIVRTPGTDRLIGLNGSGRAPSALDAALLRDQAHKTIPLESVHTVTMPGAIDAFDRLLKDHGRLDFTDVLAPAIHYAEHGVPVCRRTAIDWVTFGPRLHGPGKKHYLNNGRSYVAGQLFASPPQAEALRLIARDGRDAFYKGAIAEDMLTTLRAAGGRHSADDFDKVAATYVDPIEISYRGHDLVELPPNGQGATALLMAKILERFELSALDPNGARRVHLEAEAARLAYGARNRFIGDPESANLRLEHMLSDKTADELAALIDPGRATPAIDERAEAVHRDTVYICVVDEDRTAVSLIYSLFYPFGSGLASDRYGIAFQNRGAGFNLTEGHVNELKGGKRPLHTLIPGFLRKAAESVTPFGVMGGPFQAVGHAHLLSNLVDFDMDLQEAIDGPRSFADPATGQLSLEAGFSEAVAADLAAMGHKVARAPIGMGGAQAISVDLKSGLLTGATDPRKDGVALGM
jgi:gamma-glutamyltranspeptidase / glutathione hydrolase